MKKYLRFNLLFVLVILIAQTIYVIWEVSGLVRIVNGFLFMLFLPGYALLHVVYSGREDRLNSLELIVISFPLSLALDASVGIGLNALKIGTGPFIQLIWMSSFIVICFIIWAWRSSEFENNLNQNTVGLIGIIAVIVFVAVTTSRIDILSGEQELVSLYVLDGDQGVDYKLENRDSTYQPFFVGGEYQGLESRGFLLVSSTGEVVEISLEPGEVWQISFEVEVLPGVRQNIVWGLFSEDGSQRLRTVQVWVGGE